MFPQHHKKLLRSLVVFVLMISLAACELEVVRFDRKATGAYPRALFGDYLFSYVEDDQVRMDTLKIEELGRNRHRMIFQGDTIRLGTLRQRGQYFFSSRFDPEYSGYRLTGFKIMGDSMYFPENFRDGPSPQEADSLFRDVTVEEIDRESEEITLYRVKNRSRETNKVLRSWVDNQKQYAHYLQKLPEPAEWSDTATKSSDHAPGQTTTILKPDIYPHPFSDQFSVRLPDEQQYHLVLRDMKGNVVSESRGSGPTFRWTVPPSAAGTYVLTVSDREGRPLQSGPVVRQRF